METRPISKINYRDYITKVKDMCIAISKDSNTAFILPDYKNILYESGYTPDYCEINLTWDDIKTILSLETEMWNKTQSNFGKFISTLSEYLKDELMTYIVGDKFNLTEEEKAQLRLKKDISSQKAD